MKAVLVFEMPDDIDISKMRIGGDGNIYYMRDGERASIVGNIRNIKPMPSKKETDIETDLSSGDDYISGYKDGYKRGVDVGWNRCVSEISEGKE